MRPLALALLLPLATAACAEGGTAIGPGGLSAPFRGALVNDEQHFQCEESYDPATGVVTIKVVHDRGSKVDDVAIHEIAGVASAAIGAGKTAGAVVGAARGERPYPNPIPPPLNFPACFGTQALGYAPPAPPNPTPPYPPPQQQSNAAPPPDEALQRRLELASRAADDTPELEPLPQRRRRPALGWPGEGG
jgi:hypothetical protein